MKNQKNKTMFVVLEGPDGASKTTILNKLKEKLEKKNIDIFLTREPDKKLGNFEIRKMLLKTETSLCYMQELLLFLLDRNIHIKKLKKFKNSKSERTKIILCDRYFFSSFVYQGKIGGIPLDNIYKIHELSNSFFLPDLTFFININKKNDFIEIKKRCNGEFDKIEKKTQSHWKKISKYYDEVLNYFKKKKPFLKIEKINWIPNSEKMSLIILEKILKKLDEN